MLVLRQRKWLKNGYEILKGCTQFMSLQVPGPSAELGIHSFDLRRGTWPSRLQNRGTSLQLFFFSSIFLHPSSLNILFLGFQQLKNRNCVTSISPGTSLGTWHIVGLINLLINMTLFPQVLLLMPTLDWPTGCFRSWLSDLLWSPMSFAQIYAQEFLGLPISCLDQLLIHCSSFLLFGGKHYLPIADLLLTVEESWMGNVALTGRVSDKDLRLLILTFTWASSVMWVPKGSSYRLSHVNNYHLLCSSLCSWHSAWKLACTATFNPSKESVQ